MRLCMVYRHFCLSPADDAGRERIFLCSHRPRMLNVSAASGDVQPYLESTPTLNPELNICTASHGDWT